MKFYNLTSREIQGVLSPHRTGCLCVSLRVLAERETCFSCGSRLIMPKGCGMHASRFRTSVIMVTSRPPSYKEPAASAESALNGLLAETDGRECDMT